MALRSLLRATSQAQLYLQPYFTLGTSRLSFTLPRGICPALQVLGCPRLDSQVPLFSSIQYVAECPGHPEMALALTSLTLAEPTAEYMVSDLLILSVAIQGLLSRPL